MWHVCARVCGLGACGLLCVCVSALVEVSLHILTVQVSSLMLCTWGEQGAGALSLPGGEYIHHAATQSGEVISVVE